METKWTLVNIAANSLDYANKLYYFGLMTVSVDLLDSNLKIVM